MSILRLLLMLPLLALAVRPAAAFEETNKSYFGDIAVGGYDAVGYFTEGKAIKGEEAYAYVWNGATYLFANAGNRNRFTADPAAFAPQYGGYCSNQMSLGNLSDIDPQVWRLIDGKLYLFGHQAGRLRWADETGQKVRDAESHWRVYLNR